MQTISIEDACAIEGETIFVDANIFIFVDGLISFDKRQQEYSDAYFKIIKNNTLITSEHCISEFYNRSVKHYFQLDLEEDPKLKFKTHRKSESFQSTLVAMSDATSRFMEEVEICEITKDKSSVLKALEWATTGCIDFVDAIVSNYCIKNNLFMLTDDSDCFHCPNLRIITNNSWMLKNKDNRADHIICKE